MKKDEGTVVIINGRSASPAIIDLVNELAEAFDIGGDNETMKEELYDLITHILFYMRAEDLCDQNFKRIVNGAFCLYRLADKIEKVKIEARNPNANMPMQNN